MILNIYIYERGDKLITKLCEKLITKLGHNITDSPDCDVAIAPYLTRYIPDADLLKAKIGTLVFHPSLLPLYRGSGAVKEQFKRGELSGGGTWFWADNISDGGDICEQEAVQITGTPKTFYNGIIIPLGVRLLGDALNDISGGHIRKRPQNHSAATFCYPNNHPLYYCGA
jgi:methionyl-tRNA formyltransferase